MPSNAGPSPVVFVAVKSRLRPEALPVAEARCAALARELQQLRAQLEATGKAAELAAETAAAGRRRQRGPQLGYLIRPGRAGSRALRTRERQLCLHGGKRR